MITLRDIYNLDHNERHNLYVKHGIKMFKLCCDPATRTQLPNGHYRWTGRSCEGGGATIKHTMLEHQMTAYAVAQELGYKQKLHQIKDVINLHVINS